MMCSDSAAALVMHWLVAVRKTVEEKEEEEEEEEVELLRVVMLMVVGVGLS
jgi:hypothetical protein